MGYNGNAYSVKRLAGRNLLGWMTLARLDTMTAAVFIISHGIMGRIQEEFADMGFRTGRSLSESEAVSM